MLNEKNSIMKIKINNKDLLYSEKFINISNNLNIFYSDLLNQTQESLWWQCTSTILQYLHLLLFTINRNVSLFIN